MMTGLDDEVFPKSMYTLINCNLMSTSLCPKGKSITNYMGFFTLGITQMMMMMMDREVATPWLMTFKSRAHQFCSHISPGLIY